MDENKRAILEAIAAAEKRLRPFDQSRGGVSYDDIRDEFNNSDFGINPTAYIPPRLHEMSEHGEPPLLNCTSDAGSASNAKYRLTEHGWNIVDEEPP